MPVITIPQIKKLLFEASPQTPIEEIMWCTDQYCEITLLTDKKQKMIKLLEILSEIEHDHLVDLLALIVPYMFELLRFDEETGGITIKEIVPVFVFEKESTEILPIK